MAALREKLDRLRVRDGAGPPSGLEHMERSMFGEVVDGVPLKERLQRLLAAASRGRGALSVSAAPAGRSRVEELIDGLRIQNARGEFFLVENDVHLDSFHGDVNMSRFRTVRPTSAGILSGDRELADFPLDQAVYLDTETTGLAGGTGTAAFLVGVGWVDGDRFRVQQFFMRDYHEEAALLRGLAERLAHFRRIVTFNGRLFDVPLLESRYRLNRERFPLQGAPHLDLLHPARRLWKARLESCRLQTLERRLLGVARRGDVAGDEIPRLYFDFVRSRDARAMARVFEHNRVDIVSLAALAIHACRWVEESSAEDPLDIVSLARVFERADLEERSEREYRRALGTGATAVRVPALTALAARAKRSGDHEQALRLWEQAAEQGDRRALRELAMHHEHRLRDYSAALAVVEQSLGLADPALAATDRRFLFDLTRRRRRLLAKLGKKSEAEVYARPSG
jgi:uncharacterized protein YprB with RNaseH-like and TPR domain